MSSTEQNEEAVAPSNFPPFPLQSTTADQTTIPPVTQHATPAAAQQQDSQPKPASIQPTPQAPGAFGRQNLIGIGGQISIVMANKGVMPEDLAGSTGRPVEGIYAVMTGRVGGLSLDALGAIFAKLEVQPILQLVQPKPAAS